MSVAHGDLNEIPEYKGLQADTVVANIIADVIIHLAATVKPNLKQGGTFISSGIIKERRADVEKALLENGFEIVEVQEKGSWVCIRSILK